MNLENLIEKIRSDSKNLILAAILCAAVVYIDVAFIMKAQLGGIRSVSEKIVKINQEITSVSVELSRMKKAGSEKSAKPKVLIQEGQIPSLLQDIYAAANSLRISIVQIKPSKEEDQKKGSKAKGAASPIKLIPVKISLEIDGNYHAFGAFINALEAQEKFMSVEELKIVQNPVNYLQQKAHLTLRTYVKK